MALFKLAKGLAGTSLVAGHDIYEPARRAISDTSWGQGFDPEDEADLMLVKEILALRLKVGHKWTVRTERQRRRRETQALHIVTISVAHFGDDPSRRQLEDAVTEMWGGGSYQIWAAVPYKRVHTLLIDGEGVYPEDPATIAKAREAADGGRSGTRSDNEETLLPMLSEQEAEWLENNPDFKDRVMRARFARIFNISLGDDEADAGKGRKNNDPDDTELQASLDSNPKANEMRLAQTAAKKYGGSYKDYVPKTDKDDPYAGPTPFEKAMKKRMDQAAKEFADDLFDGRGGGRRRGQEEDTSRPGVLSEILKKVDLNPLVQTAADLLNNAAAKGGATTSAVAGGSAASLASLSVGVLPAPAQIVQRPTQSQSPLPEPATSPSAPDNANGRGAAGQGQGADGAVLSDLLTVEMQAVHGDNYLSIIPGASDGGLWGMSPALDAAAAKETPAGWMPENVSPVEWLLAVNWDSVRSWVLKLTSEQFAQVVFKHASEGDQKADVLFRSLSHSHPQTILVLLNDVKAYPFIGFLKNGDAMMGTANALASTNGQIYPARIMALLHEARKAVERKQAASGAQQDGGQGGETGGGTDGTMAATDPRASKPGRGATAPVNGPGPATLSEHIALSADDEGSLG